MNFLEFANKHFFPLICMAVGMFGLIFYAINGNAAYAIFWGAIVIINQNTLYFSSIKEMLEEKENKNDDSRKA